MRILLLMVLFCAQLSAQKTFSIHTNETLCLYTEVVENQTYLTVVEKLHGGEYTMRVAKYIVYSMVPDSAGLTLNLGNTQYCKFNQVAKTGELCELQMSGLVCKKW